jgi:hypothetical protein
VKVTEHGLRASLRAKVVRSAPRCQRPSQRKGLKTRADAIARIQRGFHFAAQRRMAATGCVE